MLESAGLSLSLMSDGTITTIYCAGQICSLANTLVQTAMFFVKRRYQDHD